MRIFDGIADLESAVGTHLGWSEWRAVSQSDVNTFADVTGDHQWIHVDHARAEHGPFGRTIVHGHLTSSLIPLFMGDVFEVRGVGMLINYGCNKVRYLTPVPTGSRLRGGVELTRIDRGPRGYQLETTVTIDIEGGNKPACVAETLTLVVA